MQHNTDTPRVLFGYRGWPQDWQGYFPEELPADWQFAYYSNDCNCLVLPADFWMAMDDGEVESWLEDIEDDFRFYLEMPVKISSEVFERNLIERFEPNLGALLGGADLSIKGVSHWSALVDGISSNAQDKPKIYGLRCGQRGLREIKNELEQLPSSVEVLLVLDGIITPIFLSEIRTVAELIGVA